MDNLKNKTALVIDNGLFLHFARKLAEGFGKVKYWTPSIKAFPRVNDRLVGTGYPDIERVNNVFEHYDEADILVYPDVGYGAEQAYWREKGKPVWGAGYGEELELERAKTKVLLKKLGLLVGPYEVVNGVDSLRKHLLKNKNVWVKLSAMRGDSETFKSGEYELVKPVLDDLEVRLGPKADKQEFVVETELKAKVEVGYDGFSIDGQFAPIGIQGIEVKDAAYIGAVKSYKDFAKQVLVCNEKLSPVLKQYGFRGLYSSEVRVVDRTTGYLIDPCCRAGSPPSESYVEAYSNWPEIVWEGGHGRLVTPKPVCKYLVELMLESNWSAEKWLAVDVPKELKQWVKWKHPCVIDGREYVIPNEQKVSLIGAVVATGNSMREAVEKVKTYRKEIKAYDLHSEDDALDTAVEECEKAGQVGVSF